MEDFEVLEETCEEKSGTVCPFEEICDGNSMFTKNREYCCLGTCQPVEEEKSEENYGWLIAIIIFIILGAGGYYLYKKQKEIVPKKPEGKLKEISEKFQKRMTGIPETKRVSGGLGRN